MASLDSERSSDFSRHKSIANLHAAPAAQSAMQPVKPPQSVLPESVFTRTLHLSTNVRWHFMHRHRIQTKVILSGVPYIRNFSVQPHLFASLNIFH